MIEFNNFPITSIKVVDNGIGFTNDNIESYYKVYSPKKISLGGKGIGRFASLSFFKNIEIESIVEGKETNLKVQLHLNREKGLVDDEPVNTKNTRKTTVSLLNLDARYAKISSQSSNPQPIGFSGILLAKRQNSFYCTYFLHNRNVADTKSPYPIKRLEVIRWFNQKSMVFNQSLS